MWHLAQCFIAKRGFSIQVPLELIGTILELRSCYMFKLGAPERPLIEIPADVWRASGRLETVCQAQLMSHAQRDEPRRALSPKNAKDQMIRSHKLKIVGLHDTSWIIMILHGCQDFIEIQCTVTLQAEDQISYSSSSSSDFQFEPMCLVRGVSCVLQLYGPFVSFIRSSCMTGWRTHARWFAMLWQVTTNRLVQDGGYLGRSKHWVASRNTSLTATESRKSRFKFQWRTSDSQ